MLRYGSMEVPTELENTVILDLSTRYGLEVLGTLFSSILWGVSCMQLFLYYITYDNDPRYLRVLVFSLWAIETTADVLNIIPLWTKLIAQYGNIAGLQVVSSLSLYFAMLTAFPISTIQTYFFHRIYIFSGKKKWFLILGIPLAFWQFTATIVYYVLTLGDTQDSPSASTVSPLAQHLWISTRVASVLADVTIALSMSYFLYKKFFSYEVQNNTIIARMFVVIVNTGIWTASMAIVSLVLLLALERTNLFLLVEVPMGMVYLNTFLANLNARQYIKGKRPEWVLTSSNVPSQFTFGIQRERQSDHGSGDEISSSGLGESV